MMSIAVADCNNMAAVLTLRCPKYIIEKKDFAIYHPALCKIFNFHQDISIHTSVGLMVVMTMEKFVAVVFPMKAKFWLTHKFSVTLILSVCGLVSCVECP